MTRRERVMAALSSEPVDRVPVALWRHFHRVDRDPEAQAERTVEFQREYGLDAVKTMPNGCYSVEDWPCQIDFSDEPAEVVARCIREPRDWQEVGPLEVTRGALGRELEATAILRGRLGPEIPIIATVFSPLTTAQKLAGDRLLLHMRSEGHRVHRALGHITRTTAQYVKAVLARGADGVFLATQLATRRALREREYVEFGRPYDLQVLSPAQRAPFNVLHIHGRDVMFELLADYPVSAVNWHVWETPPSPVEARRVTPLPFMGGLQYDTLHSGEADRVEAEVRAMIGAAGGWSLILAPGCAIPRGYPPENLKRAVEAARGLPRDRWGPPAHRFTRRHNSS